jgi:hypothetical protein
MKALKRTNPSQKLTSEIQLARVRLVKAQSELASAKAQARLAKRRRKEAKQAARRARKVAKQAKADVAEAKQLLADTEEKLTRLVVRTSVAIRPAAEVPPVKPKSKKQPSRSVPKTKKVLPAPPPRPKPKRAASSRPKLKPAAREQAANGQAERAFHPISVPRDWDSPKAPPSPSARVDSKPEAEPLPNSINRDSTSEDPGAIQPDKADQADHSTIDPL